MSRFPALLLVLIAFAQSAAARSSGPLLLPTIEYFVADGDLVVRGVVRKGPIALTLPPVPREQADADIVNREAPLHYERLTVRVAETLRRNADALAADPTGQTIEFVAARAMGQSPAELWDGREVLLSLNSTARWRDNEGVDQRLGKWVLRLDLGPNFDHGRMDFNWWAYDLSSNELRAFDVTCTRVPRGADVLAVARRAAALPLAPLREDDGMFWTKGRGRPCAWLSPKDQSDHYLLGPVDARLEAQARAWLAEASRSRWAKSNAWEALSAVNKPASPETVEALAQFAVTAPAEELEWDGQGRWRTPTFKERSWARRTLHRWGVPTGEWNRTFEGRMTYRPIAVGSVAVLLVPVAVFLAIRWYRRRRGLPFGLFTGALATLFVIGVALWVRSYWRVDEVWLGPAAARYEIVSAGGTLQMLAIRHWDEPFAVAYGSDWRTGDLDRMLDPRALAADAESDGGVLGAAWAHGTTPQWPVRGKLFEFPPADRDPMKRDESDGPAASPDDRGGGGLFGGGGGGTVRRGGLFGRNVPTATYPFTFVAIPWWWVVAVGAIGPIAWRASSIRARRWRRAGRCAKCGYDLRGAPGACPECGATPA
ncbi:MAG: hypothetical protein ACAI43_05265 [Phycisphaerae bacterium]